jgi:hypothetical protein
VNYLPGLASNCNPLDCISWIARITGMSHQRLACNFFFFFLVILGFELRASCLLCRHSCCLSHSASSPTSNILDIVSVHRSHHWDDLTQCIFSPNSLSPVQVSALCSSQHLLESDYFVLSPLFRKGGKRPVLYWLSAIYSRQISIRNITG